MAASQARVVGSEDLDRAVRSVATLFNTEHVVVIGSQALLVGRADIDRSLRTSIEFDIYPEKIEAWETLHPGEEASEVINGMLGEGSQFHVTHGFFIDGVDDRTALLAPDWRDRAVRRIIQLDDLKIEAVAPEPNDLVAAKLARGDPKDVIFARICLRSGLVRHDAVKARLEIIMDDEMLSTALGRLGQARHGPGSGIPGMGRSPA